MRVLVLAGRNAHSQQYPHRAPPAWLTSTHEVVTELPPSNWKKPNPEQEFCIRCSQESQAEQVLLPRDSLTEFLSMARACVCTSTASIQHVLKSHPESWQHPSSPLAGIHPSAHLYTLGWSQSMSRSPCSAGSALQWSNSLPGTGR